MYRRPLATTYGEVMADVDEVAVAVAVAIRCAARQRGTSAHGDRPHASFQHAACRGITTCPTRRQHHRTSAAGLRALSPPRQPRVRKCADVPRRVRSFVRSGMCRPNVRWFASSASTKSGSDFQMAFAFAFAGLAGWPRPASHPLLVAKSASCTTGFLPPTRVPPADKCKAVEMKAQTHACCADKHCP